jgi:hypothetical protein
MGLLATDLPGDVAHIQKPTILSTTKRNLGYELASGVVVFKGM